MAISWKEGTTLETSGQPECRLTGAKTAREAQSEQQQTGPFASKKKKRTRGEGNLRRVQMTREWLRQSVVDAQVFARAVLEWQGCALHRQNATTSRHERLVPDLNNLKNLHPRAQRARCTRDPLPEAVWRLQALQRRGMAQGDVPPVHAAGRRMNAVNQRLLMWERALLRAG